MELCDDPDNRLSQDASREVAARRHEPSPECCFDWLPDELVVAILKWVPDGSTVDAWSLTSRRHSILGADPALWRHLCDVHFGPSVHQHFERWSKNWRWVYSARSRDGRIGKVSVGEVDVLLNGKRGVYWGDLVDGKPHGYGAMLIPPLNEADNGDQDARGRPSDAAKFDCYEGEWSDGIISGYGICRWSCGIQYQGQYRDNDRHGYGVQTWPSGAHYEGERKSGQRHGYGVHTWANGNQYLGEWKDNKMHGHGIYQWRDGSQYNGQHDSNCPAGRGTMTYLDGSTFDGEWLGGRKHGEGTHVYGDGSITWQSHRHGVRVGAVLVEHRPGGTSCDGDNNGASRCQACMAIRTNQ
jgi:hypothetical protein